MYTEKILLLSPTTTKDDELGWYKNSICQLRQKRDYLEETEAEYNNQQELLVFL